MKLAVEMWAGPVTGFSGPEILDHFSQYSDRVQPYPWGGGAPSRRQMFEDCLSLLPVDQQRQALFELADYDGPMKYAPPSPEDRQRLREWLTESHVPSASLTTSVVRRLDWASVNKDWQRALKQVESDPEGAITAARSLIETVCKHILDNLGVAYEDHGDLVRLYKAAARALQIAPDQQTEEAFRQILGGSVSAVAGLASLRNALGDSHGKGMGYLGPLTRHANSPSLSPEPWLSSSWRLTLPRPVLANETRLGRAIKRVAPKLGRGAR